MDYCHCDPTIVSDSRAKTGGIDRSTLITFTSVPLGTLTLWSVRQSERARRNEIDKTIVPWAKQQESGGCVTLRVNSLHFVYSLALSD